MKEEILGLLLVGMVCLAFFAGCLRVMDKVATEQMGEELESWDAGDQEWLRQVFEERRRESKGAL